MQAYFYSYSYTFPSFLRKRKKMVKETNTGMDLATAVSARIQG